MLLSAVVGASAAGVFAAAVGVMIISFGWYDISASKPHGALTAWVLHTTMIDSVRARAKYASAPAQFSAEQVKQGFGVFEAHCVMCHGAPGVARAKWVMGMEPTPPYLLDAARRWSPAELRFITSHGVKMTAMPAWQLTLSPDELTSLVAFLEALPNISAKQYADMRARGSHQGARLPEGKR